jgi:hypothetical protein
MRSKVCPFETFVTPAMGFTFNDWGYACVARSLGVAIAEATSDDQVAAPSRDAEAFRLATSGR